MFIPAKDRHRLDKMAFYFMGISMGVLTGSELTKGMWINAVEAASFAMFLFLSIASVIADRRARKQHAE